MSNFSLINILIVLAVIFLIGFALLKVVKKSMVFKNRLFIFIAVLLIIFLGFNLFERFCVEHLSLKEAKNFAVQHKLQSPEIENVGNKTILFYENKNIYGYYELTKIFGKVYEGGSFKSSLNSDNTVTTFGEMDNQQNFSGVVIDNLSLLKQGNKLVIVDSKGKKFIKDIEINKKVYFFNRVNEIEKVKIQDKDNKVIF
ncbi:hypothetical protein V5E38_10630 [Rossellomorea sp. GAMAL-10_SWC]